MNEEHQPAPAEGEAPAPEEEKKPRLGFGLKKLSISNYEPDSALMGEFERQARADIEAEIRRRKEERE